MRADPGFEAFVDQRSTALLRTAYLLTTDRGHAEDLLQTALLRTLRHWRRARAAPEAYVRKVLVNLAYDRARRMRRRPREVALSSDAAHPYAIDNALMRAGLAGDPIEERVGERRTVVAALARLPIRQRQVIVLRFFADLSVEQTAGLLECSEGTVKSYTSRAVARLRELLAADTPGPQRPPPATDTTQLMETRRAH